MQLTSDQKAAEAAFIAFALSPSKSEMVISGPAGTGKTTLLRHLTQLRDHHNAAALLGNTLPKTWYITATTNKAADVLSNATGWDATTIHSTLGLTVFADYKTGKEKIKRRKDSSVIQDAFIVVDECSMVSRDLYRFIDECTIGCKILYVGDHCQMAPVLEDLSPVFQNNTPVVLNEIVRSQHTPAITALANQLRRTVETGVFEPIRPVPGVIEFLDPATAEMKILDDFVLQDREDVRILGYTNRYVQSMNQYLRTQRNLPNRYQPGECLVSNSVAYAVSGGTRLSIEREVLITETSSTIAAFHGIPVYEVGINGLTYRVPEDYFQYRQALSQASKNQDWGRYFALKEQVADLRPRDASTVYKAQGSTYRDVYINLTDIGTCTNADQAARMLYVACSRPTHRIHFIGNLPARFQGG